MRNERPSWVKHGTVFPRKNIIIGDDIPVVKREHHESQQRRTVTMSYDSEIQGAAMVYAINPERAAEMGFRVPHSCHLYWTRHAGVTPGASSGTARPTIHLMQLLVGPVKAKGVRALQLPYRQKMMDNLSYALILSTAVDLALIAGSAVTLGRTLPLVPPIKETGHVLEMTLISLSQRPTDTSLECMKYPQSWLAIHATAPQGNLGSPLSPGTGPSWTKSMGLRQGDESALRRTASKGSTRHHTSGR